PIATEAARGAPRELLPRAAREADGSGSGAARPAQGRERVPRGRDAEPHGGPRRTDGDRDRPGRHGEETLRKGAAGQEKNLELENANLAKDRFLASMSHELRTPLNAIIGFTGTLMMRLPGPLTVDQEKQLGTIQNSARHLLS